MTTHIVSAFDEDLGNLRNLIAQMGGLAEDQFGKAIEALSTSDRVKAEHIIAADDKIDVLEKEVEENAIKLIAMRQPMATDLRAIMVAIRISSDLERIGDLAKNIAKRTLAVNEPLPRSVNAGMNRMADLALEQLADVLDAYASLDTQKANDVWHNDSRIDTLYNSVFRELLTYMMEDARTIGMCTHLLFGAKNIERIGDHTTNIAENIHYLVTGDTLDGPRPKEDSTSLTPIEARAKK
ncbi:MAG: phosphate signaling complex protein PhoU [Pseudomonadota bacterium]